MTKFKVGDKVRRNYSLSEYLSDYRTGTIVEVLNGNWYRVQHSDRSFVYSENELELVNPKEDSVPKSVGDIIEQTKQNDIQSANDIQIGGVHYKEQSIEPWDYIVANRMCYLSGNVVKYVTRFKAKNGIQDLEKAKHYLEKLIETEKLKGKQ